MKSKSLVQVVVINFQPQYDIPLLGRLPLNVQIRENADAGKPSVIAGDDAAESYMAIAQKVADALPQAEKDKNRIF